MLLRRVQLEKALRRDLPGGIGSRAFKAIIERCPRVVVPGRKCPLFDFDEVSAWLKSQVTIPRVTTPEPRPEALHRRRARPSNPLLQSA